MKYSVKNIISQAANDITLTDRDFITEGGEGKIYGKAGVIYKIYHEPQKMIPLSKIEELACLNQDNLLRPQDVLYHGTVPVGFTMRWIKDTVPLCKLFTNDFWSRFNVNAANIASLVERIAADIKYVHSKKCLIVDGNEMNYLVGTLGLTIPYFIDVDSWQTPHFPATAIMPSIRDYHTKVFSELTDWFSFGIIAVQLFIGIHPFKGKHPDYLRSDLERRMRENISIFHKGVQLPACTRDMDTIPQTYKDWFIRLFEKGERLPPPGMKAPISVIAKTRVLRAAAKFIIELLQEYPSDIVRVDHQGTIFTKDTVHVGRVKYDLDASADIIYTNTGAPVVAKIANSYLVLYDLKTGKSFMLKIMATDKMVVDGQLFALSGDHLVGIVLKELGWTTVAAIETSWNILPQATKLYNGVAFQDILGVPYITLPYRTPQGWPACMIKPIPELKGYRILEAKHDAGVVMLVAFKNNQYDKIVLKINSDYTKYHFMINSDVDYHIPNFITLDNGLVVSINDEGQVLTFSRQLDRDAVTVIEDPAITFDMKLAKKGVGVYLRHGSKLYKFSMKK